MKRKMKNKKGFTLGELMTTVAVVGTISAIALPNFVRVKMQVNMEDVKQQLRTVHNEMNNLMNRDGFFPVDIEEIGTTDGELSITASLNAIDAKGFEIAGYIQTLLNS